LTDVFVSVRWSIATSLPSKMGQSEPGAEAFDASAVAGPGQHEHGLPERCKEPLSPPGPAAPPLQLEQSRH
jgi:hypothetical protein